MANFSKLDTLLPVNIWVDGYQSYKRGKHYKRIKFQLNTANRIQKDNFATISLVDASVIDEEKILKQKNCKISKKEIKQVQNFVKNNLFALNWIEDGVITESNLLQVMIKGGILQSNIIIEAAELNTCDIIAKHIQENDYDKQTLFYAQQALLEIFSEKDIENIYNFKL